jgi:hypothetical protein
LVKHFVAPEKLFNKAFAEKENNKSQSCQKRKYYNRSYNKMHPSGAVLLVVTLNNLYVSRNVKHLGNRAKKPATTV